MNVRSMVETFQRSAAWSRIALGPHREPTRPAVRPPRGKEERETYPGGQTFQGVRPNFKLIRKN